MGPTIKNGWSFSVKMSPRGGCKSWRHPSRPDIQPVDSLQILPCNIMVSWDYRKRVMTFYLENWETIDVLFRSFYWSDVMTVVYIHVCSIWEYYTGGDYCLYYYTKYVTESDYLICVINSTILFDCIFCNINIKDILAINVWHLGLWAPVLQHCH